MDKVKKYLGRQCLSLPLIKSAYGDDVTQYGIYAVTSRISLILSTHGNIFVTLS